MDLGRLPEARFQDEEVVLANADVTRDDLNYVAERIGVSVRTIAPGSSAHCTGFRRFATGRTISSD